MKLKIAGLALISLALNVNALADASPSTQLADLLNELQQTQGHFSQVIYTHRGQVLQSSTGSFALWRPGKFRWQTQTPAAQLLVADGTKIWLYDPSLNQVSWFKEQVNNKQSPAMLLVGDIDSLAKQYRITMNDQADQTVFHLQPKKESFFAQVNLVFVDETLSDMEIKDNLGQQTKIHFSELSNGAGSQLFQFSPPAGADVVEAAM